MVPMATETHSISFAKDLIETGSNAWCQIKPDISKNQPQSKATQKAFKKASMGLKNWQDDKMTRHIDVHSWCRVKKTTDHQQETPGLNTSVFAKSKTPMDTQSHWMSFSAFIPGMVVDMPGGKIRAYSEDQAHPSPAPPDPWHPFQRSHLWATTNHTTPLEHTHAMIKDDKSLK